MVKQTSVPDRLQSILGREGVLADPSAFAVDGVTPRAAVSPSTYEQVAEVVRFAHADGLAVIPWGGGTHIHIGNVPARYDIALSLSRLDKLVEYEPADLTVTCQAGITLTTLQGQLAGHGQFVPLGSMQGGSPTVGGILAANASGPSRHAFGAPRDFTIGLRVVTADGRLTRAGGRVVKNVAGYDLCKLYIGSLGTLGVIVEATFKLAPLAKEERTATAGFQAAARACEFAAALQRRGLAVRAVQLLNPSAAAAAGLAGEGQSSVVLDIAGTQQAVRRSRREAGELADLRDVSDAAALGERIRSLLHQTTATLACKASALPTRLAGLVEALEALKPAPRIVALPGLGVLHACWPSLDGAEQAVGRLRDAAARAAGSLVLERCPADLKRRLDVFGEPPPSLELMRRTKQQFDPQGVLSPGRFIGRL